MTEPKDVPEVEQKQIVRIPWAQSIWFFDIDDTLSDTSDVSANATEGMRHIFASRYDDKTGLAIKELVNGYYNLMVQGYRVRLDTDWQRVPGGKQAFDELLAAVYGLQKQVIEQFGAPKKWSREIFVKMAADKIGIPVTAQLVNEATDAYWQELSRITNSYADAVALLAAIRQHKRPIYLMTSSDARLQMQPDGQFSYDPPYSESLKRKRIEQLRQKGINFNVLSIGDPEDKPDRDFFEKGIRIAEADLGQPIDLHKAIMVGDSFGGDLQTPKEQMGFGLVVLVNRDKEQLEIVDRHQLNTNDLSHITEFLITQS